MTSKIFRSAESDNRELEVDYIFGKPRLLVKDFDGGNKGFIANKSDAPAIALAVLEAAGVDLNESWSGVEPYGTPSHLGWIGGHLRAYVRQFANDQDKAREQAELEAEALELFQASCLNDETLPSFERYPDIKLKWLAVARRAREMRAEK